MATGITDAARLMEINKLKTIIRDYRAIITEYHTRIQAIIEELEEEYGVILPTKSDPLCQRVNRRKP